MVEVMSKTAKYITLKMPIKLSRSLFGEVKTIKKMQDSNVGYDTPLLDELEILNKTYKTKDLRPVSELFKKYNYKTK